jgi:hypothetical protein
MTDTLFELSNTDKEFLHDVAIGNSSVRGYAGALYNLLTGEGVYPELPLLLEQRSTNENSFEETI